MQSENLPKPIVRVKFDGKLKRFKYPTTTVKEFLDVLREEFQISSNATLCLFEGTDDLPANSTLEDLAILSGAELILTSNDQEDGYTVKVQTVKGEIYQFRFSKGSTLSHLYNAIEEKIDVTTAYPLLFNHRMHIFKSKQLLNEPLINFLMLTKIEDDNIPHFYLFQSDRRFENRTYEYVKDLKALFLKSDLWQPKSGEQTDEAMMIYLNSIYALIRVFLTKKDADFDSVHDVYMPQFLIVLRRYLFPPACLAFKHAMEGALFNFEKALLSDALFHLFRNLLPENIPDTELFVYTPYVFCWLFRNADHTSLESACYEGVEFINRFGSAPTAGNQEAAKAQKYLVNPVRLLNEKVVAGTSDRIVLMEYDQAKNVYHLDEDDFQRQIDLTGLLMLFKAVQKAAEGNDELEKRDIFETYSTEYTLWSPTQDTNLFSIGNVSEQNNRLKKWNATEMNEIKEALSTNDLYSIFTFANSNTLSKHHHAQFVRLESGDIVYILGPEKQGSDSFLCFDPSGRNERFRKADAATLETLSTRPGVVIRENASDIRKIEQITCILFDISGSMHMEVGTEGNKHSLLELSVMAFGAWRDRLVSYRLAHALGLIYFGADEESPENLRNHGALLFRRRRRLEDLLAARVVVQCDITRTFTDFDRALENRPECGYDTPLYDAIDMAIKKIETFRVNSQSRLSPVCKQLILCLTDGVDNCSKALPNDVLEKLLVNNIFFDAISFDSVTNDVLLGFCEKTKGYYYTEVPHDEASMLNLFELEAAISLQDRDENTHGKVKTPQRRQPKDLEKPAISSKQAKISDGSFSSTSLRRIMHEINHLNKKDLKNFDLFISKENLTFWKVIMHGETGTPYSDGRWLLFIQFPPIYPEQPPEIRFVTKIYHCNINDDGKICHDVLTTAWSQKTSMYNVLMEILRLLREPNADDALSSVKGTQYKASKDNYDNTIVEWKQLYASDTVDQLKAQYFLE